MYVAALLTEHARAFDVVNAVNTLVAILAYPTGICKVIAALCNTSLNKTPVDKLVGRSLS